MIIYLINSLKGKLTNIISTDTNESEKAFLSEGVRWMFFSTLAFALANVFVKQVGHLPTMEIVFLRCLTGVAFCFVGLKKAGVDWRGSNRKMLFFRGLFGTT